MHLIFLFQGSLLYQTFLFSTTLIPIYMLLTLRYSPFRQFLSKSSVAFVKSPTRSFIQNLTSAYVNLEQLSFFPPSAEFWDELPKFIKAANRYFSLQVQSNSNNYSCCYFIEITECQKSCQVFYMHYLILSQPPHRFYHNSHFTDDENRGTDTYTEASKSDCALNSYAVEFLMLHPVESS